MIKQRNWENKGTMIIAKLHVILVPILDLGLNELR